MEKYKSIKDAYQKGVADGRFYSFFTRRQTLSEMFKDIENRMEENARNRVIKEVEEAILVMENRTKKEIGVVNSQLKHIKSIKIFKKILEYIKTK